MTSLSSRRVLVCGGRFYARRDLIFRALDKAHDKWGIACIIHGGCKRWSRELRRYVGADFIAGEWALDNKIPCEVFEAKWRKESEDGRQLKGGDDIDFAAGPMRNAAMITFGMPDMGIAFGGHDGTADMLRRLYEAGIETYEIDRKPENANGAATLPVN